MSDGNTRVTVTIPDGVVAGELIVATDGGTSSGFPILGMFGLVGSAAEGVALDAVMPSANTGQIITVTGDGLTADILAEFTAIDDTETLTTVDAPLFNIEQSGTQASVAVPEAAVTGSVRLKPTGGEPYPGSAYLQVVPTLSNLVVPAGRLLQPGVSVTILGTGFRPSETTVVFTGASPAVPDTLARTLLTVTVPDGIVAGDVRVETDGGSSRSLPLPGEFTLTGNADAGEPANTTEPSANIGQSVVVTGQNLSTELVLVLPAVDDNGNSQTVEVSLTDVSADGTRAAVTVPPGTATGTARLTHPDGAPLDVSRYLQVVPMLSEIQLPFGQQVIPGMELTLIGSGFVEGSTAVDFQGAGQVPAADVFNDGYQLTVTVPEGVATGPVTVVTPGGVSPSVPIDVKTDLVPPEVLQVIPEPGAVEVPINTTVTVRFTELLLADSIRSDTIVLSGPEGTVNASLETLQFFDYTTVVLRPTADLQTETTYTLTITAVEDLEGNFLASTFESTFTTSSQTDLQPPEVISITPSGEGVAVNTAVVVGFSEPIDPATISPATLNLYNQATGEYVDGTLSVDGTGQVVFLVPSAPLAVGTYYQVGVSDGVQDVSGNALAGFAGGYFTTGFVADTTGPQVVLVDPADGAAQVPTNATVTIQLSEPIDPLSVLGDAVVLEQGGFAVAGALSLADGNRQVVFVPSVPLAASATHTLTVSGLRDVAGNAMAAALQVTFTTAAGADLISPQVIGTNPFNGAVDVVRDVVITVQFSEPMNPATVNATNVWLTEQITNQAVQIEVLLDAGGTQAVITPTGLLAPDSSYRLYIYSTVTDSAGNPLGLNYLSTFTTGTLSADVSPPQVLAVSPPDGASDVPVNSRVTVRFSEPINPLTVDAATVQLQSGGAPVALSQALSDNDRLLTLTPAADLAAGVLHTLVLSALTDVAGNELASFSASFQTAASGAVDTTPPAVAAVDPSDGAVDVGLTPVITVTFSEPVSPVTVHTGTLRLVQNGLAGQLPSAVVLDSSATVASLTPAVALLPQTTYRIEADGVEDFAGYQLSPVFSSFFTTGTGPADTTGPQVDLVTPADGSVDVPASTSVVLTFSEPLDASTVNTDTFALYANGIEQAMAVQRSADATVVVLDPYTTLPAGSRVAVLATGGVRDLAGNALVDFYSEFAVAPAADRTGPQVADVRPQSGATAVPFDSPVVLFFSEPIDPATVPGSVFIAEQGLLVNGVFSMGAGDQTVSFDPDAPFTPGALVEVFVTPDLADPFGNYLSGLFQASFTVAADPAVEAPRVVGYNPTDFAEVPTNTVLSVGFSEAIDAATITDQTAQVWSYDTGLDVEGAGSFDAGGTVLTFVPTAGVLPAGETIGVSLTTGIADTAGTPLQEATYFEFTVGSAADTTAPAVTAVSPADGATGVGINATLRVRFSESVNALTVDDTTIAVSDAVGAAVPCSIRFADTDRLVTLVPHVPLAGNSDYTLSLSGVTDVAGNPVVPVTTSFQTGFGPDLQPPEVISITPSGEGVAVNTAVVVGFSEPIDPATISPATLNLYNQATGEYVDGTLSVDGTGQVVFLVPSAPLAVGTYYQVGVSDGVQDVSGNALAGFAGGYFTTGFVADTTGPQVVLVDPADGAAQVPTNATVTIQLSEPIDPLSVLGDAVVLEQGGFAVAGALSLADGNRQVVFVPSVPLAASATHTLTVSGLRDVAGNAMAAALQVTFTTAAGADLISPQVIGTNPFNGAVDVVRDVVITVQFSEPMNPATVNATNVWLTEQITNQAVQIEVLLDAGGTQAVITPTGLLAPDSSYRLYIYSTVTDSAGNPLGPAYQSTFTTGSL